MSFDFWENVSGPDTDLSDWTIGITPGKKGKGNYVEYELGKVTMRVYYSINYKTLSEIIAEAE